MYLFDAVHLRYIGYCTVTKIGPWLQKIRGHYGTLDQHLTSLTMYLTVSVQYP